MTQRKKSEDNPLSIISRHFKKAFGECIEEKIFVKGKKANKPYSVDLHAWKKDGHYLEGWKIKPNIGHVWVEVENKRVQTKHIERFLDSAEDVMKAKKNGEAEWAPNILIIASNRGFTDEAVEKANKKGVYCLNIRRDALHFLGKIPDTKGKRLFQILFFIFAGIIFLSILYVFSVLIK